VLVDVVVGRECVEEVEVDVDVDEDKTENTLEIKGECHGEQPTRQSFKNRLLTERG
jgi:hypothetical protein